MSNQQRKIGDGPVMVKGTTIGWAVGVVMCQWGVAMMYRTSGHKGPSPQRYKPTKECQRVVPSSSQPSPTIWGDQCEPDDRDCHTRPRRTIVPKRVAQPLTPAVHQGPDIATVWTYPTPTDTHAATRCTHNTHRARAIVLCALRRPTCPQSNTIGRNQAGCNQSSTNTSGPVHHLARTHQTDDKSKGRKKKGVHQQRVLC